MIGTEMALIDARCPPHEFDCLGWVAEILSDEGKIFQHRTDLKMIRTKSLLINGKSAALHRIGISEPSAHDHGTCKIVKANCNAGVLGSEGAFIDFQRTAV